MVTDELSEASAHFRHAVEIYRTMLARAKPTKPSELAEHGYPVKADDDEPLPVYYGYISTISREMGISSTAQQRAVGSVLNPMNCITILKRPGGTSVRGTPSIGIWVLNYEPTLEQYIEFRGYNTKIIRKTLPTTTDYIKAKLEEILTELAELRQRMAELERTIGHNVR